MNTPRSIRQRIRLVFMAMLVLGASTLHALDSSAIVIGKKEVEGVELRAMLTTPTNDESAAYLTFTITNNRATALLRGVGPSAHGFILSARSPSGELVDYTDAGKQLFHPFIFISYAARELKPGESDTYSLKMDMLSTLFKIPSKLFRLEWQRFSDNTGKALPNIEELHIDFDLSKIPKTKPEKPTQNEDHGA